MIGAPLPDWASALLTAARAAGEDVAGGVALARQYGALLPQPGAGLTAQRWQVLTAVAAQNLTAARILEAHSDALAILAEAGTDHPPGRSWGVFAAEAPALRVDARDDAGGVRLHGTKPWCSLAADLDNALVTARAGQDRQLFAVSLRHDSVTVESSETWVARGLRTVISSPVRFDATPAQPVGPPGWYLSRSGFAWGGIGVAACWFGGALALADALRASTIRRGGELAALHLGTVDAALHAAGAVLGAAARAVDSGCATGESGSLLALRVRAVVADAAERTLIQVGHALGPAPLAFDEEHTRRVADLQLYLRQHHAERDLAALGTAVMQ